MTVTNAVTTAHTRVQTFGRDNTADFTAGSKATTLFASLDDLMVNTEDAKADKSPNRVGKEPLLEGMLLDLKNFSRTPREMKNTENGFPAPSRTPDNPAESAI